MRALLTFYMVDFLVLGDEPSHVLGYQTMKSALEALYRPLGPQPLAALIHGLYTARVYLRPLAGDAIATAARVKTRVFARATMLARGNIRLRSPSLDLRRFTLDDVDDAYCLIAEGQAHGKLSIDIEGEGS